MSLVDNPKFAQLKISARLPTPKGVAMQVITLSQKIDASNQSIAHLIGVDPALSARVIKAANILLAHTSRPVVTIADAVMVLGVRSLRQLVLGIALIVDYRHGPCKQFDYPHYWTHSLLTGIIAKHLAQHTRLASADEIFVTGLFSNIGRLGLATAFPEEYSELLVQTKNPSIAAQHAQQLEKFGFDEAELSEAILADMNFPVIFQRLVRYCDLPDSRELIVATREWRLVILMYLATSLAGLFLSQAKDNSVLINKIKELSIKLAVELEDLILLVDHCARDWLEWTSLLNMNSNIVIPSLAELLKSANALEVHEAASLIATVNCSLRVLVVEDDAATLRLLEVMLKNAGHSVQLARNGVEAMRLIQQQPPQLLVSDWMMPEMDGLALCRQLRANTDYCNIYVVILTAQANPDKLIEAFEAGADDYLPKPIAPKILFARLRAAQRVIQMQEELASDREKLQRLANELLSANQQLQELALTDVLTGLPNRRAAMLRLEQEWVSMQRSNRSLACMILDIDHFKQVNDNYGHPIGDLVLRKVAQSLRQAARAQDVVCRFGGEEFLVICPDSDIEAAYQCAERLRLQVAEMTLNEASPPFHLTVSIGLGAVKGGVGTLDQLLVRVDKQLYIAKNSGRNQTKYEK